MQLIRSIDGWVGKEEVPGSARGPENSAPVPDAAWVRPPATPHATARRRPGLRVTLIGSVHRMVPLSKPHSARPSISRYDSVTPRSVYLLVRGQEHEKDKFPGPV